MALSVIEQSCSFVPKRYGQTSQEITRSYLPSFYQPAASKKLWKHYSARNHRPGRRWPVDFLSPFRYQGSSTRGGLPRPLSAYLSWTRRRQGPLWSNRPYFQAFPKESGQDCNLAAFEKYLFHQSLKDWAGKLSLSDDSGAALAEKISAARALSEKLRDLYLCGDGQLVAPAEENIARNSYQPVFSGFDGLILFWYLFI